MEIKKEVAVFKRAFNNSCDVVAKEIVTEGGNFALIYVDGMVQIAEIDLGVVRALVESKGLFDKTFDGVSSVITTVETLTSERVRKKAIEKLAEGDTILICDGAQEYFVISARGYVKRAVAEPPTSAVIKGPREGFIEDLKTNMVLLRRRFASGKIVFKSLKIGRYTNTKVQIVYLKGITNLDIVKDVEKKLSKIDVDGVIDGSSVVAFLEKRQYSVFKQIGSTEKPDVVAGALLNGRVAIMVDGSPMVFTTPFVIMDDYFDAEDYFRRPIRASLVRFMRLFAVMSAVYLPSIFVALQTHQYQILPIKLLITIINSINGIPFTPIIEMLIALVLFEVLGDASVRMPRYLGMAISVVGGIIFGETAVKAGVLSSLTVLIVAVSSIGLYAMPDEVGVFSVVRIALVVVSGALGIYGIIIVSIAMLAYMTGLENYGVPYFAPFAPLMPKDLKNSVVICSATDAFLRPTYMNLKNKTRLKIK